MALDDKENAKFKEIPTKVTKEKMELSCDLNDVEWQNRARELAEAHKKTESEKQRKKDIMAEIGADVKLAETHESKLANVVATRREQREVVVETISDYESGLVITRRTDTDEEISRREMTTNERQSGLFDFEAEENADENVSEDSDGEPTKQ